VSIQSHCVLNYLSLICFSHVFEGLLLGGSVARSSKRLLYTSGLTRTTENIDIEISYYFLYTLGLTRTTENIDIEISYYFSF